jgi:hypothetical protein
MATDQATLVNLNDLATQYASAVTACRAAGQAAAVAANTLGVATRAAAGIPIPQPGASTANIVAVAGVQAALARAKSAHDAAVSNAASAQTAQDQAWAALLAAS